MTEPSAAAAAVPTPAAAPPAAEANGSSAAAGACPPEVLRAIYGDPGDKQAAYEASLRRWWGEYADRKNDEGDEHVADSLLYDRSHLPRSAPAPDCVRAAAEREAAVDAAEAAPPQQQ